MRQGDVVVDARRTAKLIPYAFEEKDIFGSDDDASDGRYQEPGKTQARWEGSLTFACPGCGRVGSIAIGSPKPEEKPSWSIDSGDLITLTNLTLSPSIHCVGCCGWHGYLKNGVFESC